MHAHSDAFVILNSPKETSINPPVTMNKKTVEFISWLLSQSKVVGELLELDVGPSKGQP